MSCSDCTGVELQCGHLQIDDRSHDEVDCTRSAHHDNAFHDAPYDRARVNNFRNIPISKNRAGTKVAHRNRRQICIFISPEHGSSRWLGSRVVSVLGSGAEGPGFKSQSRRCRVTVLGKLFTPIQAAKLVAALLRVAGVTAGLAESNGSLSSGL